MVASSAKSTGEPVITVGIMDRQQDVEGCLNGPYLGPERIPLSGPFRAQADGGAIVFSDSGGRRATSSPSIDLSSGPISTFTLSGVTIGNQFHWERREDQSFRGDLVLRARDDGTFAVINRIPLEEYLESVISSEMSSAAPPEFLKVHAMLSRSWLLAALARKREAQGRHPFHPGDGGQEGLSMRWYDREDHDLFDVCADDHCQRYQGITKIGSVRAKEAVRQTRGLVITYLGEICDARYSKACGGITEDFGTAWGDVVVPYLTSRADSPLRHSPVGSEDDARQWILSRPSAYCNTEDRDVLESILPDFDRETKAFFRWKVAYERQDLERIVRKRSGIDFGTLEALIPLRRGPSGRIWQLRIVGSRKTAIVGKELEIRRWLSETHLYSSAFVVETERGAAGAVSRFTLHGAGWGHGVGLCQIGAAVMATKGFSAEQILGHYFAGTGIEKIY